LIASSKTKISSAWWSERASLKISLFSPLLENSNSRQWSKSTREARSLSPCSVYPMFLPCLSERAIKSMARPSFIWPIIGLLVEDRLTSSCWRNFSICFEAVWPVVSWINLTSGTAGPTRRSIIFEPKYSLIGCWPSLTNQTTSCLSR